MYIAARGGGPEGRTDPLAGTDSISPHSYPELFDDWFASDARFRPGDVNERPRK